MFKCPKCKERMRSYRATKDGRRYIWFVCSCGWTNKPKDLEEPKEE